MGRVRVLTTVFVGCVALALCTGCSDGQQLPLDDQAADKTSSVQAQEILAETQGFFRARGTDIQYETGPWRLVQEATCYFDADEGSWRNGDAYDYRYDNQGMLVERNLYLSGTLQTTWTWEREDDRDICTIALHQESDENASTRIEMFEDGDTSRRVYYDAAGDVTNAYTTTITVEDGSEHEVFTVEEGDGTVSRTTITDRDERGNTVKSTTYAGDPETSGITGGTQYEYVYDDNGRILDRTEYTQESGVSLLASEQHNWYGEGPERLEIYVHGPLMGTMYEELRLAAYDADGRLVFQRHEHDIMGDKSAPAEELYYLYDEKGNPISIITQELGVTVSKRVLTYDDYGNLISSVEAEYDEDTQEPDFICYNVYEYENADNDERTAAVDVAELEIPQFDSDEDAFSRKGAYFDTWFEDTLDGGWGYWEAQFPDTREGAVEDRTLIISSYYGAASERTLELMTTDAALGDVSSALHMSETSCYCVAVSDDKAWLLSADGARLTVARHGDDQIAVEGVLGDGTELDVMASWTDMDPAA